MGLLYMLQISANKEICSELIWINIPKSYLLNAAVFFSIAAVTCMFFIIGYLIYYKRNKTKNQELSRQLSPFIGEVAIAESEEEILQLIEQPAISSMIQKTIKSKTRKAILVKEMMNMHKSMLGTASANLRWLYIHLNLQQDAIRRLDSPVWFVKAGALQELAEMRQEKIITKIYRATNSRNDFIRKEAQLAVVKLTGFDGLRFLNIISYPLTEWQQLALLEQLSLQKGAKWENLDKWLKSDNETVVEFSLRLVEKYQLFEFHDATLLCMEHISSIVRTQALKTLKEIAQPQTASYLEHFYLVSSYSEQLNILDVIKALGSKKQLPFLTDLLQNCDVAINYKADLAIKQINSLNEELGNQVSFQVQDLHLNMGSNKKEQML